MKIKVKFLKALFENIQIVSVFIRGKRGDGEITKFTIFAPLKSG